MSNDRHELKLQLNEISDSELNPTLKQATFSILDLEISGNLQKIDKNTLDRAIKKINHLPIYADYLPVSEAGAGDDNFTDHKPVIDEDRDGNDIITTDTIVIGHFVSNGRYEDIDGETVVVADAVLYVDKYPNQIELLKELLDAGIKINTSCEYYYSKNDTQIIDGVEYIGGDIIFVGHTILGSNPDGQGGIVDGAFESSRMLSMNKKIEWNKSLNKAINELKDSKNKKEDKEGEGMEKVFEIMMNALSHDDIRSKLYSALESVLSMTEWYDSYIYEVYDDKFVLKVWEDGYANVSYHEFSYTKTETEVEIDMESRTEVMRDWVSVQNQLQQTKDSLEKAENDLKARTEDSIVISHNKKVLEDKLEEATKNLISMNEKLEKLSEIEEQYNQAEKEKALNARKQEFKVKFKKVNALEVFEGEEVQSMIEKSLEDDSMVASLNSMIIDLIPAIEDEKEKSENSKKEDLISGITKSVNNLVPEKKEDVLSKYIIED